MSNREVTLKVYSAELSGGCLSYNVELKHDLEEYLNNIGKTLEERMMPVGRIDVSDEVDFISWYEIHNDHIFGCILRMKKGIAKSILKEQLKENMISYEEIESKENKKINVEGFIINRYYFCVNNTNIVLGFRHNIDVFETYINFLISQNSGYKKEYIMNSVIKDLANKKEEDFIKKIVIGKKSNITKDIAKDITNKNHIRSLFKLFNTFDDFQIDDVLEAKIILTVKNPDEAKLILNSVPNDYIRVLTAGGEIIDGKNYKANKVVSIACINNVIIEEDLRQKMYSFLFYITKHNGSL
ncbi:hypothetical protein [Brachyspira intermedia]|uniref:hypothetical protein n=1 Tax=Brachyspira intermedia TaxID=84377 RepID=UPI003005BD03